MHYLQRRVIADSTCAVNIFLWCYFFARGSCFV